MSFIKNKILSKYYQFLGIELSLIVLLSSAFFSILLSVLALFDSFFLFSTYGRWYAFFVLFGSLLFFCFILCFKLRHYLSLDSFFETLENFQKEHHNFLKNTWFFLKEKEKTKISQAISCQLNRKSEEFMRSFPFRKLFFNRLLYNSFLLSLCGCSSFLIFSLQIPRFELFSNRIVYPWKSNLIPYNLNFTIIPNDTLIIKDSPLKIVLLSEEKLNDFFYIEYKYTEGDILNKQLMSQDNSYSLSYQFKSVNHSIDFRIVSSFFESPFYHAQTVEYPAIVSNQIFVIPPEYTGKKKEQLPGNLNEITVLKGSKLEFEIEANHPLRSGEMFFNDSLIKKMNCKENKARCEFTVMKEGNFYFSIEDTNALKNLQPIQYLLSVQPDLFPVVKILYPAKDIDISNESELPIQAVMADDFGIRKAELKYRLNDEDKENTIPIQINKKEKDQAVQFVWDLTPLQLFTDDQVSYYLLVEDNDIFSQFKKSKSKTFIIRVPSLFEIVNETNESKKKELSNLEKTMKEFKEIDENYQKILNEFRKNTELSKEKQQELMSQMEKSEELAEKIQKSSENFENIMKKIEKHQALTEQTMDKMKEIENLMKELKEESLNKLREKLNKQMENLSEMSNKENLEDLQDENKEFMKKLERTIALLKKLQAEEKLSQMTKKIEEIEKEQKKIEEEFEEENKNSDSEKHNSEGNKSKKGESTKSSQENKENLLKKEQKLKEQLENLDKDMNEFKELLEEAKSKFTRQADELQEKSREMNLPEQMKQTMSSAQQNKSDEAKKKSKKMRSDMKDLQKAMAETQKQMEMEELSQLIEKMKEIYENILYSSQSQENLYQTTQKTHINDQYLSDLAENQQQLFQTIQETADSLALYSKSRAEITQQSMSLLGQSMLDMKKASENMISSRIYEPGKNNRREYETALESQNSALSSLNQSAYQIYSDLQAMEQAKKSCSNPMPMPMAGMKQMSEQQKQINQSMGQMMQQMKQNNGGKMSREQAERMQQLAFQQAQIAKQLEEYLKEQQKKPKNQRPLGRMDKTVEDMIKTAEELENNMMNDQTIDRNEKILSRMLDSEKSMSEREFTNKRKAESGKSIQLLSPEELDNNILFDRDMKKMMILEAFKDKYPKNFETLIQEYLNSLLEEQEIKNKQKKDLQ